MATNVEGGVQFAYYTKKHRGGCMRGSLRPGHLITNRVGSEGARGVMTPDYRL